LRIPHAFFFGFNSCLSQTFHFVWIVTTQVITGTPFWQGTAEVVFSTKAEALAALKKYNNVHLDGKPMKIEVIGTNIEAPAPAIFAFAPPPLPGNFSFLLTRLVVSTRGQRRYL
jgi:hypothetical protein